MDRLEMANEHEAKVLKTIAETLSVWRKAVEAGNERNRPGECDTGIRSLELLNRNADLLCRCASDYGAKTSECSQALRLLDYILPDIRSRRIDLWSVTNEVDVLTTLGFINELRRWADRLIEDQIPRDRIDLAKAIGLYHRSRAQIKRDIKDGLITDYRKTKIGKHWISKSEADNMYIPK
jgi:hypothetical protein